MGMVFYVLPMATYPVRVAKAYHVCMRVGQKSVEMAMQAADSPVVYSSYVESLDETAKAR